MRAWLAGLLLFAPLSSAFASPEDAFTSAVAVPSGLFFFQRGEAPEAPAAPGRALCEEKPLVGRAPLTDDMFYLRNAARVDLAGLRLRIAGNKDATKKGADGWYFALLAEGDPTVYWVLAHHGKFDAVIKGRSIHFDVALNGMKGIRHHEYISVKLWDDAGNRREITTGQMAYDAYRWSPKVTLLGRDFRVNYTRVIAANGAAPRLLETHAVTVKNFQEEDGGANYKVDELGLQFLAEKLEASMAVKPMKVKVRSPRGPLDLLYGFRVKNGALEVLDVTDYSGKDLPACD